MLASGRFLPDDNHYPIRVHRAVKFRIDHPETFVNGPYMQKTRPRDGKEPVWVD